MCKSGAVHHCVEVEWEPFGGARIPTVMVDPAVRRSRAAAAHHRIATALGLDRQRGADKSACAGD